MIATAIYVTGSANLQPGRRYAIAIDGTRLQILGPTDIDPSRVAIDRPLETLDARAIEGRFIISDQHGWVLAFMSVAGPRPADLAAMVTGAARGAVGP